MKLNTLTLLLLVCIVSIFLVDYVYSRGRGGGSRGGSSRSYSSSRSYRSSSSSRSYRSSRSYGSRYGKYAAAAAAGYTVYGMTRYRSRYTYGSRYYRSDPNICTNLDRYVTYDNGTVSKTQKLNYFVCPYDSSDDDKDIYCCGSENSQYCCAYWQSSKAGGAIAGIVIGSLLAIIILSVCLCCCCKKKVGRNSDTPSASYQAPKTAPPDYSASSGPYEPNLPYPMNPPNSNPIGFEANGPPPTYDKLGDYPPKY